MASQPSHAHQNRRLRKLPSVVRRNRGSRPPTPAASFYTYQTALLWMRSKQDDLSRFVQLLQTYPNLIQDESMDRFWDFIEPLLLEEKEAKSRGASAALNSPDVRRHVTRLTGGSETPTPSNFQSRDTPSASTSRTTTPAQMSRTPLVHVITRIDQSTADGEKAMHSFISGILQEDFFVKVTKTDPSPPNGPRRDNVVTEADVCVYLFNESTLADPRCFSDLCVALSRAIPVVYVRHPKLELSQAFADTILRNSKGYASWRDYVDSFELNHYTNIPTKKRYKDKLEPLDVKCRPSSACDSPVVGKDGRRGKRRHSPIPSDNDLVYTLTNAFKDAFVFDETDAEFTEKLKHALHKSFAACEAKPELLRIGPVPPCGVTSRGDPYLSNTSTPTEAADRFSSHRVKTKPVLLGVQGSQEIISTLNWPISGQTLTSLFDRSNDGDPEEADAFRGPPLFRSAIRMVKLPPLEQQKSTYLIFDRNGSTDGPKRVEFPLKDPTEFLLESEVESDDLELVRSPIQFHEIDLSREVNGRLTPESDNSCSSLF